MREPKERITIKVQAKEQLLNLCLDTLEKDKQALVFASTKRGAEKTAEDIGKKVKLSRKAWKDLSEKALKSLSSPTKQCKRLSECLKKGIAFHHAGLTASQRELIEEAYKRGDIKIIASTPTLAAGLDLPAFRAIIRDVKRYSSRGLAYIPVLEYLQMSGRAGRPKYDKWGEAICLAASEPEAENLLEKYIEGEPEDIYSKLAVEPVLRTYLLSLIATRMVKNREDIIKFFEKTFWAHQFKDMVKMEMIIDKMLDLLEHWEFIRSSEERKDFVSAYSIQNQEYKPTRVGMRTSELYLDPLSAHNIIKGIRRATGQENVHTFAYIQMIANNLEMYPLLRVTRKDYDDIQEKLLYHETDILEEEPSIYDPEFDSFLNSIKTAACMEEWANEANEEYILEKYQVRPGELRMKLERLDWLFYSAIELGKLQSHKDKVKDLMKIRLRLKHGIKEELLPLVRFKNIGRVRARKLFRNRIRDVSDIKGIDASALASLVGRSTAKSLKEQVGEKVSLEKVKTRKGQGKLHDY